MAIYITSDLHFGHQKNFLYEPRGFSSIEEHDRIIIENINSVCSYEDELYILGDLVMGDLETGINKLNQIQATKFIILGNHDTINKQTAYKMLNNTIILGYGYPLKYKKYRFFLSHYPTLTSNFDSDKPLKRQVISIAGHCHTKNKFKDMDKGLIYHVELDAHNNKPILLDNIITDIQNFYTSGNA